MHILATYNDSTTLHHAGSNQTGNIYIKTFMVLSQTESLKICRKLATNNKQHIEEQNSEQNHNVNFPISNINKNEQKAHKKVVYNTCTYCTVIICG